MRKLISLFLAVSFLGMNCATYQRGEGINLEPGQKPGAQLVIQKKDGEQVRGELIAVKKRSLLLKVSDSGADMSVDISEIKVIKIVKKSKALLGVGIGLALGAILSVPFVESMGGLGEGDNPIFVYSLAAIIVGAVLAIPLSITGVLAGLDETIRIEGRSDSGIKKILEELRKKARVPDYQ